MDWALHQPRIRFDIRAERQEYERLFNHQASVLQLRMVRRGQCDRTKKLSTPEWEKVYQVHALERRVPHQARVLSWGKEKAFYFAHKTAA